MSSKILAVPRQRNGVEGEGDYLNSGNVNRVAQMFIDPKSWKVYGRLFCRT
jgi:hypothetical protein